MADAAADASEHETLVRDMSKVLKDIADMLRANKEEFSASVFARSQDLDEEDIRTALRVLEAIGNGGAPAVAKKKKTKEIQLMSTKEELAAIVAQIKAEAQHYRSTMANKPIVGENISLTMADADLCEPLTKELFMARCAKFNAAQDATTISSKVASAIAGLFFIRCHQQNQESLHKIAEANGIDKKYIYRCAGFFNLVQAFPFLLVCRITFYKIDQFKPALVKAAKGDPELLSALQERPPAIKTSTNTEFRFDALTPLPAANVLQVAEAAVKATPLANQTSDMTEEQVDAFKALKNVHEKLKQEIRGAIARNAEVANEMQNLRLGDGGDLDDLTFLEDDSMVTD